LRQSGSFGLALFGDPGTPTGSLALCSTTKLANRANMKESNNAIKKNINKTDFKIRADT